MRRITATPRQNWQQTVEMQGLTFHSKPQPYWTEQAYYAFSPSEIETLQRAANEVHEICIEAAKLIVDKKLYSKLAMPEHSAKLAAESLRRGDKHLYGRFDFAFDGKEAKMLEYNADTPTSLIEGSIAQFFWAADKHPTKDQFNCLHESLVARWGEIGLEGLVHFATTGDAEEDRMTTEYIRECAAQAGLQTNYLGMNEIAFDGTKFTDQDGVQIKNLFKLYPWEWMMGEEFGKYITNETRFVEPPWKMLLSNKGILPILNEIAPNHPNLLKADTKPLNIPYVKKPLLSREGCNITIVNGDEVIETPGKYGEEGYIFQEYKKIPEFDRRHPVLGLWMIGDKCSGMGIRESDGPVTLNNSYFAPHIIEGETK